MNKQINESESVIQSKMVQHIQQTCWSNFVGNKLLGLRTLETRRVRADLIEVYKIVNGIDKVDRELFQWKVGKTRGNSLKMFKKRFRINIGKYSFSNRAIDNWNRLNNDIVTAKSLNLFKGKLDSHLRNVAGLI